MILLHGESDDLIELEGDIREEFYGTDEPTILAFSTGDVLSIQYDDAGYWRIAPIFLPSEEGTTIKQATAEDGSRTITFDGKEHEVPAYSDYAYIGPHVQWVVVGNKVVKSGG